MMSYRKMEEPDWQIDQTPLMTLARVISGFLENPNEPNVVAEVRQRRQEVIEALDEPSIVAQLRRSVCISEESIALLFELLSDEHQLNPAEEAERQRYLHALDDDEAAVGRAFGELLDMLPEQAPVAGLEMWFGHLDDVGKNTSEWLLQRPDVVAAIGGPIDENEGKAARRSIELLASRGIRPLTVLHATQAIEGLVDPVMHPGLVGKKEDVWFAVDEKTGKVTMAPFERDTVIAEIEDVCDTTTEIATALLAWLIALAEYAPSLFNGCRAEGREGRIHLRYTGEFVENLFERWRPTVYAS